LPGNADVPLKRKQNRERQAEFLPRPALEVADVFRRQGPSYRARHRLPRQQLRVMSAIEACRTSALGGHVEQCGHCQYRRISYNSCRNRHCPKCQNTARARWVARRKGELLPVGYFHVVFTIPSELNDVALQNAQVVYKILFDSSAQTLNTIAADPQHLGARIGFFSILHTWGQNLLHHPHVHCVATGGGLSPDQNSWVSCRPGFFLSVRVLSRLFRRLFLQALERAFSQGQIHFHGKLAPLQSSFPKLLQELGTREWVVYAKPPFGGPQQVIEYLGRYTHRIAISNQRLRSIQQDNVEFEYRDYRHDAHFKTRCMKVSGEEFIRRFLLHTLPPGFQRIRHYGLLASRNKNNLLALCRSLLTKGTDLLPSIQQVAEATTRLLESFSLCPKCHQGQMERIETLLPAPARVLTWDSS
jgi:hypothetical protein